MSRTCLVLPLLLLAGCAGPGGAPSALPDRVFPGRDISLAWDGKGGLHAVHVVDDPAGARVVYRRLDSPKSGLETAPVAVSPPGVVTSAGGETPPVINVLPGGGLVVAYTVPLPGRWKNRILLQTSADGGATWSAPRPLPNGGDPGSQHQLSTATASGAGDGAAAGLVFAWLESRGGVRGLRAARTRDGEHFEPDSAVDGKTCECCGTALLAGGVGGIGGIGGMGDAGDAGRVWLAYRDVDDGDRRDIHLAASRDGGATFAPPRPVAADGWKLPGCPDQGPRLAEAKDGALWAAWFTGAEPGVYAAESKDGGATFGPRQPVAVLGGDLQNARRPEIGTLPDGRIAVLYQAFRPHGVRRVEARLRSPSGTWSAPLVVEPEAGVPRLAVHGDRGVVALARGSSEAGEIVVRDWRRAFPAGGS